jgi:Kef-type K+ transport system membrane component KefB
VLAKFAGALLIRATLLQRVAVGIAMIPRGEVGLIFAELGRSTGIFNMEVYAGMVIVIAFTTLMAPLALKWFYAHYGAKMETSSDFHESGKPVAR